MRFAFVYIIFKGNGMKESYINQAQSNISLEIFVHLQELDSIVDEYLNKFDRKEFFVFSDDQKRDNLYKREYYEFISKLPDIMASVSSAVSRLSVLLERADNELELDMIVLLGEKIERCFEFERELGKYIDECKKQVTGDHISPSTLVSSTRKLKGNIEALMVKINNS